MKPVTVDGQTVVVIPERGLGDGGIVLRYMVEELDGTYSQVGEWYSSGAADIAQAVLAEPDDEHLRYVIGEARRQTLPKDQRGKQQDRPIPAPEKRASEAAIAAQAEELATAQK